MKSWYALFVSVKFVGGFRVGPGVPESTVIALRIEPDAGNGVLLVEALGGGGTVPCLLQSGQQHGCKNSDNGNHYEQFDQSEVSE